MIIAFTDRINPKPVLIFAIIVFLIQQLEHTDITFSLLTAAFILTSAAAYNAGRGLSFPSGAYIFFNATLTAIVGLTYKLFLFERGESNLLAANETMLTYCVGMVIMGAAAGLSHKLRPKRPLLPNLEIENMRYAAIGCMLVGGVIQYQTARYSDQSGTVLSALHQLNYLPRMSMIFATLYQLGKTGGKSATNWIVWASGFFMFFFGIITFSKEGLFMPIVTWGLTLVLYRFNFRWKTVAICAMMAISAEVILVPFSQYGRRSRASTSDQTTATAAAIEYLKDPFGTRSAYLDELSQVDITTGPHLYKSEQGMMDRMNMLSFDDALIAHTDQAAVYGLFPVFASYASIVPHFIWKDKPAFNFGNSYAHEIGLLAEDDDTTGISFSPLGDAYHQDKWFAILVIFPPVIFLYFFITDSLTGSVRDTPYALLPIALASHAAPEGMMATPIYLQTYGAVLLIFIAVVSKYALAYVTRLVMGGDKTRVERTRDFLPEPRQVRPIPQPGVPRA